MVNVQELRIIADQVHVAKSAKVLGQFEKQAEAIINEAGIVAQRIIDNLESILQAGAMSGSYEICIFDYGSNMEPSNEIERLIMCNSKRYGSGDQKIDLGEEVVKILSAYRKTKGFEIVLWNKKSRKCILQNDSELKVNFQLISRFKKSF